MYLFLLVQSATDMDDAVLVYGYYIVDILNIFKDGHKNFNGKSDFLHLLFLILHYYCDTHSVFTFPLHSKFPLLK